MFFSKKGKISQLRILCSDKLNKLKKREITTYLPDGKEVNCASIQTQKITILESNNFSCYGRAPVSWHNSDRNTLGTIKKLKGGNI